MSYSEVDSQLL